MTRCWMIALLVCGIGIGAAPVWASWDTSSEPNEAKRYFKEGLAHEQAGRYTHAIKAYTRSRKYKREWPELINRLGVCHTHLRQYKRAVKHYTHSLWLNPKQVAVHTALGELYVTMKKYSLARKESDALRTLDPGAAEALQQKIDLAQASKRPWYKFW